MCLEQEHKPRFKNTKLKTKNHKPRKEKHNIKHQIHIKLNMNKKLNMNTKFKTQKI